MFKELFSLAFGSCYICGDHAYDLDPWFHELIRYKYPLCRRHWNQLDQQGVLHKRRPQRDRHGV